MIIMEEIIKSIIKLNIKLEGALRVALDRPTPEALEAAKELYLEMGELFAGVDISGQPDHELNTVKEQEAEGAEETPLVEPDEAIMGTGKVVYNDEDASEVAAEAVNPTPASAPLISPDDFRKSLTINDKFLFTRELFNGSEGEFNDTIQLIGSMHSLGEVREYLLDDLQWDIENPTVKDFMTLVENLVQRR